MDAFFARNRLSAYLDGELTSAEAREVEAALARDPALRAELDELRRAVDLLRGEGIVEPPRGFAERLATRLEREPMPTGWRRWARSIRPEGLLLAALALFVVMYVGKAKDLPNLELPKDAEVAKGQAFEKGEEGDDANEAQADAAAPAAEAAEGKPQSLAQSSSKPGGEEEVAPAKLGKSANGILGDEKPYPEMSAKKEMKSPSRSPGKGTSEPLEIEPWQPEWEKEAALNTGSVPDASSNTGTKSLKLTSPPPFRYRVVANDDLALKQLAAIAKELGGELQDSRGRAVAAFQLEEGESRSVRVSVPAHNAAVLAQRLRELGEVTTVQQYDQVLADPNAQMSVQVDIQK